MKQSPKHLNKTQQNLTNQPKSPTNKETNKQTHKISNCPPPQIPSLLFILFLPVPFSFPFSSLIPTPTTGLLLSLRAATTQTRLKIDTRHHEHPTVHILQGPHSPHPVERPLRSSRLAAHSPSEQAHPTPPTEFSTTKQHSHKHPQFEERSSRGLQNPSIDAGLAPCKNNFTPP